MTLGEMLHGVDKPTLHQVAIITLLYLSAYEATDSATAGQVKGALKTAGKRKEARSNMADVLSKGSPNVRVAGTSGRSNLYSLTKTGRTEAEKLVPEHTATVVTVNEAQGLESVVEGLNTATRSYVEEAIVCLRADALRAAVVFLWAGAVQTIQEAVVQTDKKSLDASIDKRHNKPLKVRNVEHLSYLKESTLLMVAEDVGIFDRNQRAVLTDHCLDLRNKCGHPGAYRPGVQKVRSFIEDVVSVVFARGTSQP